MSALSEALDELDQTMLDDYTSYCEELLGAWESFSGNKGQMSIVKHHIIPAVRAHCHAAKEQWPYGVGPDDYLLEVQQSFYPMVIDRAFSNTLSDSYDQVLDYWIESDGLQAEHDSLLGYSLVHSTNPPWS